MVDGIGDSGKSEIERGKDDIEKAVEASYNLKDWK